MVFPPFTNRGSSREMPSSHRATIICTTLSELAVPQEAKPPSVLCFFDIQASASSVASATAGWS